MCLVVHVVPTLTVKQTSCKNNEGSEWKTLNAPSKALTRAREARCYKHTLCFVVVVFMGWPHMYAADPFVLLCTLSFRQTWATVPIVLANGKL